MNYRLSFLLRNDEFQSDLSEFIEWADRDFEATLKCLPDANREVRALQEKAGRPVSLQERLDILEDFKTQVLGDDYEGERQRLRRLLRRFHHHWGVDPPICVEQKEGPPLYSVGDKREVAAVIIPDQVTTPGWPLIYYTAQQFRAMILSEYRRILKSVESQYASWDSKTADLLDLLDATEGPIFDKSEFSHEFWQRLGLYISNRINVFRGGRPNRSPSVSEGDHDTQTRLELQERLLPYVFSPKGLFTGYSSSLSEDADPASGGHVSLEEHPEIARTLLQRRGLDSRILVEIDTDRSKKDIINAVEDLVDAVADLRKAERVGPLVKREHAEKYDTYLRVYDLRERRLTFEEIAEHLHPEDAKDKKPLERAVSRVKAQYRAAYRIVYGRDYKPIYRRSLKKEDLSMLCATCDKRQTCRELCPEVRRYVEQGQRKCLRELLTDRIEGFADPSDGAFPSAC